MKPYPEQKLEKNWIRDGINEEIIEWAKSFAEKLTPSDKSKLSTSQLRKFFGEIKRIKADYKKNINDLPMLEAQLAYAVGRDKDEKGRNKTKIKEFYEELSKGIKAVRKGEEANEKEKRNDFNNFVKIVESIVAYHKYFGGK
ncbi:MAG: type III-A CRISPR-associated protein Csm2 [Bacteroidales bacterium]|nr:type III-A CRISPR-associated protein Csm2 [Bacteroidales bacterium]